MKTPRLSTAILRAFLAVALASLAILSIYTIRADRELLEAAARDKLEAAARVVAEEAGAMRSRDALQRVIRDAGTSTALRFTVIGADGAVWADSSADPMEMENHRSRPEVAAALGGGAGYAHRSSATVGRDMLYVAVPVMDEGRIVGVARAASPARTFYETISEANRRMTAAALLLAVMASSAAYLLARTISRPIERMTRTALAFSDGRLDERIPPARTRELDELGKALNRMAGQVGDKISAVERLLDEQKTIFASMLEGLLVIDHEQRIVDLNRSAAEMLGMAEERARGRHMLEVVRNRELVRLAQTVLSGADTVEGMLAVHGPAETRHLQAHGTFFRRVGQANREALQVLTDVTRLRQLEAMRRDFVANASHELKTPVTSIQGFAETLKAEDVSPEEAKRFLDIIHRQTAQLSNLIDDLLSLTRIEHEQEAGSVTLTEQRVLPVLESAVESSRREADEKGIRISLEPCGDLTAPMDSGLMERAVANLVDNAVKYSAQGAVRVGARMDGTHAVITVSDDGPGIPREHLGRIFERFYRVDKARSRKLGGTGLGLSIVKHIVQAHGGDVAATSQVGKGSTFAIRWPASGGPQ